MFQKLCLAVITSLLYSTVVSAQVTFEHKFPEETKYITNRESKMTQTLTLAGMNFDTKALTFSVSTTKISKRAADGRLSLEEKADSLQSDISMPQGMSLQFDSANPDKTSDNPIIEPILDIFRAAFRLPVTVELDSNNKISNVKLPDGEFEKLSPAAKERLDPETLKKAVVQAHECFPDGAVKKGDTWERSSEVNAGGGQIISLRTTYEYAGTVEKDGKNLDKIKGKAFDVNYSVTGNAVFQVTKSDLKIKDSEITILFDRELGAIVSHSSKTQMAGPLTLVINNMELAGSVDLTVEGNVTRQK